MSQTRERVAARPPRAIAPVPAGRPGASVLMWRLAAAWVPERLALMGILLVSAVLNLYRLDRVGYGNTYYAAAVRSMLDNWHVFFFASFDPGGFVSVDKPPLGLWVQTAFAKLFGFHGFVLLLPQALAAVASVALGITSCGACSTSARGCSRQRRWR